MIVEDFRLFGPKSGLGKFKCPDIFSPSYLRDVSAHGKRMYIDKSQESFGYNTKDNMYIYNQYNLY